VIPPLSYPGSFPSVGKTVVLLSCRHLFDETFSSDFPTDPERASCLVAYLGMSHCISLSPSAAFPSNIGLKHNHIEIPQSNKVALLLSLPMICKYIQDVIDNRGRILVHCPTESTAATAVCAYRKSTSCCHFLPPLIPVSDVESARFLQAGFQGFTRRFFPVRVLILTKC
jgi:hypothetical protein